MPPTYNTSFFNSYSVEELILWGVRKPAAVAAAAVQKYVVELEHVVGPEALAVLGCAVVVSGRVEHELVRVAARWSALVCAAVGGVRGYVARVAVHCAVSTHVAGLAQAGRVVWANVGAVVVGAVLGHVVDVVLVDAVIAVDAVVRHVAVV